jgi:hypothetical protein
MVFVVVISHREGMDVTVHQSHTKARDYLADYCRERWSSDDPPPDDPEEAIIHYFEDKDEYWTIRECAIYE